MESAFLRSAWFEPALLVATNGVLKGSVRCSSIIRCIIVEGQEHGPIEVAKLLPC